MAIKNNQRKFLKGRAHHLQPQLTVGNAGVTEALLKELEVQLQTHELIKVKLRAGDREMRDGMVTRLVETSNAELIGRIGNVAILFRANRRDPQIKLPK